MLLAALAVTGTGLLGELRRGGLLVSWWPSWVPLGGYNRGGCFGGPPAPVVPGAATGLLGYRGSREPRWVAGVSAGA